MVQEEKSQFLNKNIISLNKIHEFQEKIKDIDPALSKLYPVVIVEEDIFYIFDLDEAGEKYEFKLEHPAFTHVPRGVRASLQLDYFDMKPLAVVSDEVFDDAEGYATIFHEFVHCYQWENKEMQLKMDLEVAKRAMEKNDFMWELEYPFPYEDEFFIERSIELKDIFENKDYQGVINYYKQMKEHLNQFNFEYMIWQQWKEGFARYIENLIRNRIGLNVNDKEINPPFDRVSFYCIGSKTIDILIDKNPKLKGDLEGLFYKMLDLG